MLLSEVRAVTWCLHNSQGTKLSVLFLDSQKPLHQDYVFTMYVFFLKLMYISDYNSYKSLECFCAV